MEQSLQFTFSKAVLTSVFAGFVATVVSLIFNIWYRGSSGFQPSSIINVSSLIFSINILFAIIGVTYYGFIKAFPKGDIFYFVVFALLIAFCIWKTAGVDRTGDPQENVEFRTLLDGLIIICGVGGLAIPLLFHNRVFEKHVI
jgi:hypothetical protein